MKGSKSKYYSLEQQQGNVIRSLLWWRQRHRRCTRIWELYTGNFI